jgi:hypothetical protein
MTVRTIREVKKGQELCLSYVDLYQPRHQRQEELLTTKHFACQCERCAAPIETSKDRMLNGFSCKEKGCKGVMIPTRTRSQQTQPPQQQRNSEGSGRGKGKGGKGKGKASTANKGGAKGPDTQKAEKEEKETNGEVELLWCDVCGQSEKKDTLKEFEEQFNTALQRQTLQMSELAKKCEEFETLLKETRLHPLHSYVFNIRILLINLYDKLNDNVNSIRYDDNIYTHTLSLTWSLIGTARKS